MKNLLSIIMANKHTTSAAGAIILLVSAMHISAIIWPQFKDKFSQIAVELSSLSAAYGLAMAGDGKKPNNPDNNQENKP